jgi:hypothetical protein
MQRKKPDLEVGRCCWVCGRVGGAGFTSALRVAGYDVPARGVIAYAHSDCMARALKRSAAKQRARG